MIKGRLTRQELSWLLTQEAQNAAERLRSGVQILRTQAPPSLDAPSDPVSVDASLDALDDVMRMLSSLHQRTSAGAATPRRGRIDLAAVLWEIAPDARVSIQPGSGTEILGDESDLRRMLQVMLGHGGGDGSSATVRRDGDDVRVSVALGPDSSPTAETERVWLSRMAKRYGGRHELEGGTEVLVFPAEGAGEPSEREALRRELDLARKQGEIYARELAAALERGEETTVFAPFAPFAFAAAPVEVDLVSTARAAVQSAAAIANRERVNLAVHGAHDANDDGSVYVWAQAKAIFALVRGLVENAVLSSPEGGSVNVSVLFTNDGCARLVVDDSGPSLPASARKSFLSLASHAGAYGRPSALPVFMAAELAACQGAALEISDAPSGGLRVAVAFPNRAS
ncbi:MAG: hypothetical protein FWD73_16325 [Polyangiaceae bacterium]|nr:hypothetical protein [Polyangiaceae bacterium]